MSNSRDSTSHRPLDIAFPKPVSRSTRRILMCLLYIIAAVGTTLVLVSGQYSEHRILFWVMMACAVVTGFNYRIQKSARVPVVLADISVGVFGFVTIATFLWLCVVVWL